jgi:hypothetical protein
MKPKAKNKSVMEERLKFVVPTHKQIEEDLQRELQGWQQFGRKGPYPFPVLDFIIGQIGCEIESAQGNEDLGKDIEYYNPTGYINGITNGELYYSLYKTILKMTEEDEFEFSNLALCDQQVFAARLDLAINLFTDLRGDNELNQDAVDLWIFYSWCRRLRNQPVWENENGETISPPEIEELTEDDWEQITGDLNAHFLEDSDAEFIEMVLLDEQPHWPTFQEFRKAKAWLMDWYGQTRWNRKRD